MESFNEISMDGFKVVSGEYVTTVPKPTAPVLTISDGRLSFTKRDVLILNTPEHVLIRVNGEEQKILIVPTKSTDKDAVKWVAKMDPVEARKITCYKLTDQLFDMWGWDKSCYYRAIGRLVIANDKVMLLFDFSNPEVRRKPRVENDK